MGLVYISLDQLSWEAFNISDVTDIHISKGSQYLQDSVW